MNILNFAVKTLFHPIDAFDEVKKKNFGSLIMTGIIVLLYFFITVFSRQYMNFRFNFENPETLNIFLIFIRTVLLYLLWVVSNWAFCTLLEGKGKLREISIVSAYALIPYLMSVFSVTILSNFIGVEESIFITLLSIIGTAWSAIILVIGHMVIHEYSLRKTIVTTILTLAGIMLIIFIVLLVGSLFQQLFSFIQSIVAELFYRWS